MLKVIWQVPLFALGVYLFYRGARLFFSDVCFCLDCGAKMFLGPTDISRNEEAPPFSSWQSRLLYYAVVLVAAVYLWSFL
jgi:hypothetical protein